MGSPRLIRGRLARFACAPAALLAAWSARAEPRPVEVPLVVPHAFLRRLLVEQVFTEPGTTARITALADPCNQIVLSEPRVGSAAGDRLLVAAHARAQAGLSWPGGCIQPLAWEGEIEAEEQVRLAPGAPVVLFTVVNSSLHGKGGLFDAPALWDWVKPLVHPRLEVLRVDLGPLVSELRRTLPLFAAHPDQPAARRFVESLALADARVDERGLALHLRFEVDAAPEAVAGHEPPLSREELRAFEDALFEWDAFVTFAVKVAARDALSPELRSQLLAALLDAREDLVAALAEPSGRAGDRVRKLFTSTWGRLAPVFAGLEGGAAGWNTLAFVASGDALAALDAAGPAFGFEVSSDGLRRLARTLAPAVTGDPLAWNEAVDPELRRAFGFDAELPGLPPAGAPPPAPEEDLELDEEPEPALEPGPAGGPEPAPEAPAPALEGGPAPDALEGAPAPEAPPEERPAPPSELPPAPPPEAPPEPPVSWLERIGAGFAALVAGAPASAAAPVSAKSAPTTSPLDGRVPRHAELDRYLPEVADLLGDAAAEVLAQGRLERDRHELFRHLVLATAWQESCWRQYVLRRGRIETLRSSAGALGLMQVNPRVWRGFYAVDGLSRSIRYNAVAGSEILLHYLRDCAIERGEEAYGRDALARATYGAYNGGPSHLRRYRAPKPGSGSLTAIDASFLAKYRAVAAGGSLGVRECFPG